MQPNRTSEPEPAVKRCKACLVEFPRSDFPVGSAMCRPCKAQWCREWRARYPEKQAAADKRWRENNIDHARQRDIDRYYSDPEAARRRVKDYYARNADQLRAKARQRRKDQPERLREIQRKHRASKPEQHAKHEQTRRARIGSAFVEAIDHLTVFERDGWCCGLCGGQVERADATLDHIVPLARGGEHSYRNVQTAHRRCNESKGARWIE